MITEAFNTQFHHTTPNNQLNFIGATIRYFNAFTDGFDDETKNIYIRDYNNRIFPMINPGISIELYDEQYINSLLNNIQKAYSYNNMTILTRYHHLLLDPCEEYYKDLSYSNKYNPLWGAGFKFSKSQSDDDIESALLRIPKSLSSSQETTSVKYLLNPNTDNGVLVGLASMLCTGIRNNEAAGLNFGDVKEMTDHPGYYTLRIIRTSKIDSNKRKAGGKTRNATRRLPLLKRYSDYIIARKEYICSQIMFPYTDKNNTFNSIDDLPIACRGDSYTIPCSASDLTRAGRVFLRDKLKMREQDVSGLSYLVQHSEYDSAEKDPTTYLLRRNLATHLYTLGFPIEWCQYYMGHIVEDDILKRSDFNDEVFLYQMALLLEKHPMNQNNNTSNEITIPPSESSRYFITIENKELNDPISISLNCPNGLADVIVGKSNKNLPTEIDITRYLT